MTNPKLPPHLEARREAIAAEVRQMVADAEHWNSMHPNEKPIIVDTDITKDVEAEVARRAAPASAPIKVNGAVFVWSSNMIAYAEVIVLDGHKPDRILSVVYRHGPASKPEGILMVGKTVAVVPGMVFNVADTSNA